jgi:heterogeneous nuclear rnp K-like protein 2
MLMDRLTRFQRCLFLFSTIYDSLKLRLQAFGLIVRRINDEPFDVPSVPGSRAVTIKFMIPNSRMGSVIGKGGSKIKEIQEASGARLTASEGMLPGSTEVSINICT